ncbi:MAG: ABC transporter permease subunit [Gammaproteobacteria bacterium]|nr:Gldg family protein [Gammaproteobacteria bacterium]MXX94287.1 ABC transporter permease subunit [Gammaproteobacteria bacterium]MYF52719.1 ABC transporter permease subunit [Gammaproteobacteria bacterium]MYK43570.1 ABC transporter permease subunit [Gammaproteobacteria bacterium]
MNIETLLEVAKKELRLFFGSPIGYLFLAAFLGCTLFVFFWGESFFARQIADVRPMFEWLPVLLIFLCSALTMRVWSDERRTGTYEYLITLPATSWELVLGKFLACYFLLVLALVLTLSIPISVSVFVGGNIDWGPVLAGYVAAVLLGSTYLSIGLFVSARSENQIVSLILSVFVSGLFYLVGSDLITTFTSYEVGAFLRELGTGSRFESIIRGVLDFADLYYFLSLTTVFLVLNVFVLGSLGWANDADRKRHITTSVVYGLIVANLLVANVWIGQISQLRLDVTEGSQYTVSNVTRQTLHQLEEPLLIRGYFSAQTHPKLAPLVPQIRDLIEEYEVIGGRKVRVEFLDPLPNPEIEEEANSTYGIRPTPLIASDRYASNVVNVYFDILIRYGEAYEVLSFFDLIETKVEAENDYSVELRNPEYDITRAIRKVISEYQLGGSIFNYLPSSIQFTGYLSAADRLPPELEELKAPLQEALEELKVEADGKFDWNFVDPDAGDGTVANEILENYGFRPMAASLFDSNTFYFYLTLSDGNVALNIGIPEVDDVEGFKRLLNEGLKRFSKGLMTSVAIHAPTPPPQQYMNQPPTGANYDSFFGYMTRDFDVELTNLRDPIPAHTDVLVVVGPSALDDEQVFEIDQFLMKGGTVIVATGGYETLLAQRTLTASRRNSGLDLWLAHNGIEVDGTMVLDEKNSALPLQVARQSGGLSFYEIQMVDYPYFVDIRDQGFVAKGPMVYGLQSLTYAWGSPISVDTELNEGREIQEILRSSDSSWLESYPNVAPQVRADSSSAYTPGMEQKSEILAVNIQGTFTSFFDESPALVAARERAEREAEETEAQIEPETETVDETELSDEEVLEDLENFASEQSDTSAEEEEVDTLGVVASVIERSPESARLIVIGSSDLLSDQAVQLMSSGAGAIFEDNFKFIANLVDVTNDESLLSIRNRGHFNRLLPPIEQTTKTRIEIGNYIFIVLGLAIVFGVNFLLSRRRLANYSRWLGVSS